MFIWVRYIKRPHQNILEFFQKVALIQNFHYLEFFHDYLFFQLFWLALRAKALILKVQIWCLEIVTWNDSKLRILFSQTLFIRWISLVIISQSLAWKLSFLYYEQFDQEHPMFTLPTANGPRKFFSTGKLKANFWVTANS